MGKPVADILRALAANRRLTDRGEGILIGLVGRGIKASRTPAMHEREAGRLGLACTYVLIDFDALGLADGQLGDVVAAARDCGFAGLNVTHPFKQAIIGLLEALAPEAEVIGAVNTVVFGTQRTGHNTDSFGFAESFRDGMQGVRLGRVLQFGAGGGGAAVAHALLELGVEDLVIVDSDAARGNELATRMAARFGRQVGSVGDDVAARVLAADGLVNATPVGMAKYPGTPFDAGLLTSRQWVAEIVYFPAETELLRQARALGCRTLSGTGMAVYQAVRAFELFTGHSADPFAMARHFEAA